MDYIYHVFSSYRLSVYNFDRYPIILSIATLRRFDTESRVFVIDRTPQFHDWLGFPDLLGFRVITDVTPQMSHLAIIQHRLSDLKRLLPFLSQDVVYCDSDVFWTSEFEPVFAPDKLSMVITRLQNYHYVNSGFFYFRQGTPGDQTFHAWEDSLCNWQLQDGLLSFLADFYGIDQPANIGDEGVMGFLINKRGWLDRIAFSPEPVLYGGHSVQSPGRLVHLLSCLTAQKTQLVFRVKELNTVLRTVLGDALVQKFGCDPEYTGDLSLTDLTHVRVPEKTQKSHCDGATKGGNQNCCSNDRKRHGLFLLG